MEEHNPYAPPTASLERPAEESPEARVQLAGRWARLWGALIDSVLGLVITLPVMFATGFWERAMAQTVSFGETVLLGVVSLVIFLAIHGYLLANHGQTIGKRLARTRIVSVKTGEILSLWEVFGLRYLPISVAGQIPVVGQFLVLVDTLFIFRNDKRCIHDLIAGTRVVEANTAN